MAYTIVNNEKQMQFEIELEGDKALLEYRFYKKNIALMHTYVPPALEGRGLGSALAKHALEWAQGRGQKIMVYCPYVAAYLKRHPEYNDLVDRTYVG